MCVHIYTHIHTYVYKHIHTKVCLGKVQPLLTSWERFVQHWCNLAAKESGLKCTCGNNDDFTVLVSGGGRRCWVSMCTVWPSHSKWVSKKSKESASNFALSLNIPPQKLLRWFRGPQLWATGDWQLHHNALLMHHVSCRVFLRKIKSSRWLSPATAQIQHPETSGFSQN